MERKKIFLAVGVLLFGSAGSFAVTASFQSLGTLAGCEQVQAWAVSADGSVVVGRCFTHPGVVGFRWTAGDGFSLLGEGSEAYGVSADGSVVVGGVYSPFQAFRWTAEDGIVELGGGQAWDVSTDGSVVVGEAPGYNGFRWTAEDGMVELVAGGEAHAVSADGSVVVGTVDSIGQQQAFRWTAADGVVGIGGLPGSIFSVAYDVSADGSVVVGGSRTSSAGGMEGLEGFRWTAEDGMVSLGYLPGGNTHSSIPTAVSADGSVVVGSTTEFWPYGGEAYIWDEFNGMRSVRNVLTNDFNIDLTGWNLLVATGISADGRTIVGYGVGPTSIYEEAWIAVIPEPSTLILLGLGGLTLLRKRR